MGLNIDGNNSFLPNFFKTGSSEQNQEVGNPFLEAPKTESPKVTNPMDTDIDMSAIMGGSFSSSKAVESNQPAYSEESLNELWTMAGIEPKSGDNTSIQNFVTGMDRMSAVGLDITDVEELFPNSPEVVAHTLEAFSNGSGDRIVRENSDNEYGADISTNFFDAMEYIKFNRGNV